MSKSAPAGGEMPVRRIDRILSFMSLGLLAFAIICFFAIMIGSAVGADFATPLWQVVGVVVYIAPIIAFALMLAVIIMAIVRRARANRAR